MIQDTSKNQIPSSLLLKDNGDPLQRQAAGLPIWLLTRRTDFNLGGEREIEHFFHFLRDLRHIVEH